MSLNATCETGFWKPEVSGCPVCGPDGPCTVDPEQLAEDMRQWKRARREGWVFRVVVVAALLGPLAAWLLT